MFTCGTAALILVGFVTICILASPLFNRRRGVMASPSDQELEIPDYPPAEQCDLSPEALRAYDGSDAHKPLLVAAKGHIYDMAAGKDFYGKGGPYNCFAGRDASVALAKVWRRAVRAFESQFFHRREHVGIVKVLYGMRERVLRAQA